MTNTPLEPVKGSWDVEITKVPGREYTPEEIAEVDAFAKELSSNANEIHNDEETTIPESIAVITLRKI